MRNLIHRLASLKIAVTMLIVLLVAMSAGTIVESARGSEAAWKIVYYSWWFQLLQVVFAVNVLASIIDYWPWGARRTGFLMTHSALLIILIGAAVTQFWKIEGHLPIWEGETANQFSREATHEGETITLPFAIRLDAFEIDMYPGTMRPAMFRSRVVVQDAANGKTVPAVIQMNQELSYGGWKFFQSSYQQTEGREQTVLAVSKDPGQPIVFFGYGLLLVGMVTVLSTRISQARQLARLQPPDQGLLRTVSASMLVLGTLLAGSQAFAAYVPDAATTDSLRALPIQHDGRSMPLDTLAREAVRGVTGGSHWRGFDPVALVLGWSFSPQEWANEAIVKVGSSDLAQEVGLPPGTKYASFHDLVQNPKVMQRIRQARAEQDQDRKLHGTLAAASKLEQRLIWMNRFFDRGILAALPHPTDPKGAWTVPPAASPADLQALLQRPPSGAGYPTPSEMAREIRYNEARPTRLAWIVLVFATLLSVIAMRLEKRWIDVISLVALVGGFGVMTWGIAIRWAIADRIPAANMYESLLFLAWGVGFFALIAFVVLRNRLVVLNAAAMSALTMALTDVLPIDGFIHPVAPVLANTPWLAIHVPIIMISYSVLALGVLFAHMQIGIGIFAPKRQDLVTRMNDLLYWYVHVGSILLIAGIITGSIWASFSWGRYWGWDPKEVWSLVAFFAYLAILHARFARYIGPFAVAAISIAAFWTILMTYLGVNFVLAAGLHSYGFGTSSVVNWMSLVAALEIVFVVAGFVAYRRTQRSRLAPFTA